MPNYANISLSVLVLLLNDCKSSNTSVKEIIGDRDTRVPLGPEDTAAAANIWIIKDTQPNRVSYCTGYSSAQNEITTAYHCINTDHLKNITLESGHQKHAILGAIKDSWPSADVVTLSVDSVDTSFEAAIPDPNGKTTLIGFDVGTNRLVKSTASSLKMTNSGSEPKAIFVLHQLDTLGGQSGSPMLQNGKVVAMHLGGQLTSSDPLPRTIPEDQKPKNYPISPPDPSKIDKSVTIVPTSTVNTPLPAPQELQTNNLSTPDQAPTK